MLLAALREIVVHFFSLSPPRTSGYYITTIQSPTFFQVKFVEKVLRNQLQSDLGEANYLDTCQSRLSLDIGWRQLCFSKRMLLGGLYIE